MQLFSYFLFFVVIGWILFSILLPIKNENSIEWQKGNANSAPIKSYLLIKLIIMTVLSFIF
jgi:predicted secreted protein